MFCLHQTLEFILHSQQGLEREGDLPRHGGGRRCEWMDGVAGLVTPTLDDHVSVNVITVVITAYMMKWQKVLTQSALILAVRTYVSVTIL